MDKSDCSFQQLPFSSLFNTYIYQFEKLSEFYPYHPFDEKGITNRIDALPEYKNRKEVVGALSRLHERLGISEDQQPQLEKLRNPDALVFVTGQQLGVLGGPLYTIYKTLTTILLARKWEKALNRPVIPVFWLADEDHDFEEIAWTGIPGKEGIQKATLSQQGTGKPVAEEVLEPSISDFLKSVQEILPETEFSAELWKRLAGFYEPGQSYVQAFARLMNHWFAKHGVLIAGSNSPELKVLLKDSIKTAILKNQEIFEVLETQSRKIEAQYHRQVVVGHTQLFLFNEQRRRLKLDVDEHGWRTTEHAWSQEELLNLAEHHPETFSPNVFLRPVMQDVLLPTIGYVAGPGEVAYYGQMKTMYEMFDLTMPVIYPRLSITLLESGIQRIMEKLPYEMCRYNQRIEDLEKDYIQRSDSHDIDGSFNKWIQHIHQSSTPVQTLIEEIDPTLLKTTGKIISGFENELQKLKGRLFRTLKQQEETQLKRIAKIKSQLFPDGLQERSVTPIYFENKYGPDIWGEILEYFETSGLDVQKHHIYPLV